ncbi:MAG: hypothetical protein SNJ52_03590 [Verrucomicrobiia bacterium]
MNTHPLLQLVRALSVLVIAGFSAASPLILHASEEENPAPDVSVATDKDSPSPNETPSTVTHPAPAEPETAPEPASPANIYFLMERVTAHMEGGLKGLPAGTKVRVLDKSRPKWTLTDMSETAFVEVDPSILTKDEGTAKAMLIEDTEQRQAALAARALERQRAEEQERLRREEESKAFEQNRIPQRGGLTGETNLHRSTLK